MLYATSPSPQSLAPCSIHIHTHTLLVNTYFGLGVSITCEDEIKYIWFGCLCSLYLSAQDQERMPDSSSTQYSCYATPGSTDEEGVSTEQDTPMRSLCDVKGSPLRVVKRVFGTIYHFAKYIQTSWLKGCRVGVRDAVIGAEFSRGYCTGPGIHSADMPCELPVTTERGTRVDLTMSSPSTIIMSQGTTGTLWRVPSPIFRAPSPGVWWQQSAPSWISCRRGTSDGPLYRGKVAECSLRPEQLLFIDHQASEGVTGIDMKG